MQDSALTFHAFQRSGAIYDFNANVIQFNVMQFRAMAPGRQNVFGDIS